MEHHCHAIGCNTPCPPRWLMCKRCWRLVPAEIQREVYRTVELRGDACDATWAPWWRAQALAIAAVHAQVNSEWDREAYIEHEFKIADHLERKGEI